ncbi:Glutathione gamma-glutamylcysteinyltransferase (Partial), partial [Seminavis robusta]
DEDEEYPTVTRSAAASSGNYFYRSRRHKTPTRNVHPVFSTTDAHPHPTRKQPEEANMVVNNNNNAISPKIQECTCGYQKEQDLLKENAEPLPPPLPQPVYSVHKRVLPSNLTALSSPLGRQFLLESMAALTAESYWALTEQFVNQSDPAYCGVTTLLMVLNAMNIDPGVRWKGGWRFYGDEDVLLQRCCLNKERIRRVGITMEQFMILGTCHGTRITMKRPPPPAENDNNHYSDSMDTSSYSLQEFRKDLKETLDSQFNRENSMIVTSYSRAALQQTGDGHFSPIAAFHEPSDHVLILDVARFKYPPYWVSVKELYESMQPVDEATQLPRGWYVMTPPSNAVHHSYQMTDEDRRPAHLVPLAHEKEPCPLGEIKVQFCPAKAKAEKEAGVAPKELQ